jgi:hypothetical protein
MSKYLLAIYGSTEVWDGMDEAAWERLREAHGTLIGELIASGEFVDTSELAVENSKVVRTRDGETIVTDGPFVESREILGGYYLVDVVDEARAIEIAARLVEAEFAPIDVRPIVNHES